MTTAPRLRSLLSALLLCTLAGSAFAATRNIRDYGAKCDGVSNDAIAVQAAVEACQDGDILLVPGPKLTGLDAPGVIIKNKKDFTLRGVDGGGFSMLGDGPNGVVAFGHIMMVVSACENSTVENLVLSGNGMNAAPLGVEKSTECTIKNLTITNVGHFTGTINDSPSAGFLAAGNKKNQYVNISLDGTAHWGEDGMRGLWIGNPWPEAYEWYPIITGCRIMNTGYTGIGGHPIASHVYNNEVFGTQGGACIKQVPAPPSVSKEPTIIEHNYCHDSDSQGIQIDGSHHVIIRNNLLVRNRVAGVFMSPSEAEGIAYGNENVTITYNTIIDNGPLLQVGGIWVHGAKNLEISHNVIRDTRPVGQKAMFCGIGLDDNYQGYDGLRITDNYIEGAMWIGIALWGGPKDRSNFTIANNVLKDNGDYGITSDPPKEIKNLTVTGNVFINNGKAPMNNVTQSEPAK